MRKLFKILIIILVIFIIATSIFALVTFGDLASYTATGSEVRSPTGQVAGKAIVVYNAGLTGAARDVASKIADLLKSEGYEVTFAGVRSEAAANLSGFDLVVIGGPIYAGKPTASIQAYLNGLNPPADALVGVFGRGSGPADSTYPKVIAAEVAPLPSDSNVTLKAVMKIGDNDDADALCQGFVTSLLA